jgi:hypothetical protein
MMNSNESIVRHAPEAAPNERRPSPDALLRQCGRVPAAVWLFLASLLFVTSFSGKAIHIDDTCSR